MPASFAPRSAITCMMVTEMSAPVGDGSYRQPPSLFCVLMMSSIALLVIFFTSSSPVMPYTWVSASAAMPWQYMLPPRAPTR